MVVKRKEEQEDRKNECRRMGRREKRGDKRRNGKGLQRKEKGEKWEGRRQEVKRLKHHVEKKFKALQKHAKRHDTAKERDNKLIPAKTDTILTRRGSGEVKRETVYTF